MSASRANTPTMDGPTPTNPGRPAAGARKKAPVSIFNPKKKAPVKKPLPANTYTAGGQVPVNGTQALHPRTAANGASPKPSEPEAKFQEFPVIIEKSALMRGLHFHGFRMQGRPDASGRVPGANLFDEKEFTRPVRLYRRRPQDKPQTAEDATSEVPGEDDKERELREAKRAERQAEREANQALIAPTGDAGKKPQQRKKPQKTVEDVFYDERNPKFTDRTKLRYEEARPWHLEDFDDKNRWVGRYEKELSHRHVLFEVTPNGFAMRPVEKWYKMTRTDRVKQTFSDAQIEKMMAAKVKLNFGNSKLSTQQQQEEAQAERQARMAAARKSKREGADDDDDAPVKVEEEFRQDVDEIDFEYNNEFQDDDEGFIFGDEGDEEAKEAEKKTRAEQRNANLPDAGVKGADDIDWVDEERKEREAEEAERKRQKKLRKQLRRKEERHEYDSDEDVNMYRSSSDSDDSETEREKEEEEQKRRKDEASKAPSVNGERSGASTKGTNTPTGRAEKKLLKRDVDASDLSGNESSRKRAKLNGAAASSGQGCLSRKSAPPWNKK